MLWVGGSILIHGLETLGFGWLEHHIKDWAQVISSMVPQAEASVNWFTKAAMDGVIGLAIIPLVKSVTTMRELV